MPPRLVLRLTTLALTLGGCGAPGLLDGPDGGVGAGLLPTTRQELQAFGQSRAYVDWPSEPAPHRSAGPHGGNVRTWVTPGLAASLKAGASAHPAGSMAVKELYGSGTTEITGWAINVKRDDGTWVFYEGFKPQLDQFYFVGTANLCGGCHSSGSDQVLTPPASLP